MKRPHIIVLGNEKGGCGKSTTAMHLIMSLQRAGVIVGALDLDARQRTLSRYFENRERFAAEKGVKLYPVANKTVSRSSLRHADDAEKDERQRFEQAFVAVGTGAQVVVIDCPGSDNFLSRLAHSFADTIVTPVNDSFVDVDLLARINPDTHEVEGLSLYAEMVFESRKRRAMRDKGVVDWIVLRNRVSGVDAKNKRFVEQVLQKLSKRLGFRFVPGFGERVIYRELFLKGLTLVDLKREGRGKGAALLDGKSMSMSKVAARQELRRLMEALNLPDFHAKPIEVVKESVDA